MKILLHDTPRTTHSLTGRHTLPDGAVLELSIAPAADGLYWSAITKGNCIDHGGPCETVEAARKEMQDAIGVLGLALDLAVAEA